MKGMWKILQKKVDDRAKRVLAAWLGVCIVLHLVFSGLAPIGSYAGSGKIIEVTVTKNQIDKALTKLKDADGEAPDTENWEDRIALPFKSETKKEAAKEFIDENLLGMAIATAKDDKKYPYIVAVYSDFKSKEPTADEILFIGLNGSDKDVTFKLKIKDKDVTVQTLIVKGYQWDSGDAATSSTATGSDATGSDAEKATPDAPIATDDSAEGTPDSIASGSDLEDNGTEFVKISSRTLKGEELDGLVSNPTVATPGQMAEEADPPALYAKAGGIVTASAKSEYAASYSRVAGINAYAENAEVESGNTVTFTADADYSSVNKDKYPEKAYFTMEFEAFDHKGNAFKRFSGPDSDPEAKTMDKLSGEEADEWRELQELLAASKEYQQYADADGWKLVTVEKNQYFYCADAMMAVFSSGVGDSVKDVMVRFIFENGVTPDGTRITATPGILNRQQLEDAYNGSFGPAGGFDDSEDYLPIGEPVETTVTAKFLWKAVTKTQSIDSLGNWITGKDVNGPIVYSISAQPEYESDPKHGIMYTKAYTITDVFNFEGFTLPADVTMDNTGRILKRKGTNLFEVTGNNKDLVRLEPVIQGGKVTGVKVTATIENHTLEGDSPIDMLLNTADIQVKMYTKNVKDNAAELTGLPSVKSEVYLDAYSILHEGDEYQSSFEQEVKKDEKTYSHSYNGVEVKGKTSYPITKQAFTDENATKPATGSAKVFNPGSEVFYKITVENEGYSEGIFTVRDVLPAGIVEESAKLVSLKIGGAPQTIDTVTQEKIPNHTVEWRGITIPSGKTAELVFRAKIKEKGVFNGGAISTKLNNKASWCTGSTWDETQTLGDAEAVVYVKAETFQKGALNISKGVKNNNGSFKIGDTVEYTLTASTKSGANEQWITLRDTWPAEAITLTNLYNIPKDGIVNLIAVSGDGKTEEVIGTYVNTTGGGQTKTATSILKKGESVDSIKYVDISVLVNRSGVVGGGVKLEGKVKTGGTITNNISGEGIDGDGVTISAIGLSIKKDAFFISEEDSKNITGETEFKDTSKIEFNTGDVVCYEVEVKNTGVKSVVPTITDHLSELFDGKPAFNTDWFAKAALNGEKGSIFYQNGSNGIWRKIEIPQDGKIVINGEAVSEEEKITVEPNASLKLRIYLTIPMDAVSNATKTYTNKAVAALKVDGIEQPLTIEASAPITTLNPETQKASIEKEVYAVGRDMTKGDRIYFEDASWNADSEIGPGAGSLDAGEDFTVGKGDYVLYRMTINNLTNTPLNVYEIEDWLPEGMEAQYFFEFNGDRGHRPKPVNNKSNRLNLGSSNMISAIPGGAGKWLYYWNGNGTKGSYAAALDQNASRIFISKDGRTYRARIYGETNLSGVAQLKPNSSVTWGLIAQVTGDLKAGETLVNTAGAIIDSTVDTTDCSKGKIAELAGDKIGGMEYTTEKHQIITATAEVKTAKYAPGIQKELSQYAIYNQWYQYDPSNPNASFAPTDSMRWTITLMNGDSVYPTSGDIKDYVIKDTLQSGLNYNPNDTEWNKLVTVPKDAKTASKEVKLPKPLQETDEASGNTVLIWSVKDISTEKQTKYQIIGADGEQVTTDVDLSIPAQGTLLLQVGSKKGETTLKFGTYKNRADLIPGAAYKYDEVCAGQVVGIGENKSIFAVAQVDIFGSGRTESWKEISATYDGASDTGNGRMDKNSVWSDDNGVVTYKLNVTNRSDEQMNQLILIDHLPDVGDNGLVNNSPRLSDFKVKFEDNPEVEVEIVRKEGENKILKPSEYQLSYGTWSKLAIAGSALPDNEWSPQNSAKWSSELKPDVHDSLKIAITDAEILKLIGDEDTVTVTFKGRTPKAESLSVPKDMIAWNSFGYSYSTANKPERIITVEPAKVGVQIATADLSVTKKVESPLEVDYSKEFTFRLEASRKAASGKWEAVTDAEYTLKGQTNSETDNENTWKTDAEGCFKLTDGQTAQFKLLANYNYRVLELNADGFVVRVKPFQSVSNGAELENYNPEQPPTVKLEAGGKYSCTFINAKNSIFLPETGGEGTGVFHRAGASMILLAILLLAGNYMKAIIPVKKKEENE